MSHYISPASCPVCGLDRHVVDPRDGKTRARKYFFFFPLSNFVRSLYGREDLVPFLHQDNDSPPPPESSIRRSRGWKEKVTDNDHISGDKRNLALIGTTDGVPLFDDQHRGAWPFIQRVANLPDSLSMNVHNIHLHALSANEYWEEDKDARILRRRIRGPKSLQPYLTVIADDFQDAYWNGIIYEFIICTQIVHKKNICIRYVFK